MSIQKRVDVILKTLDSLYPNVPAVPLKYSTDWELLVAVILSAQCTDKKVNEVTVNVFDKYTSLDDYVRANQKEFEEEIRPTGFYRNKTKHILQSARMIQDRFDGVVPNTMKDLLTLPGVARKTANVILGIVYNTYEGIVVDTHIKRLSIKFGLVDSKSPEAIEKELMKIIPHDKWWDFSSKLKAYGQDYSPAHKKNNEDDPISVALQN